MSRLGSRGDVRTLPLVLVTPVIVVMLILFYTLVGSTMKDVGRDAIAGEISKQEAQRIVQAFLSEQVEGAARWKLVSALPPEVVAQDLSKFLNARTGESATVRESSCELEEGGMSCVVKVRVEMPYGDLLMVPFGNPMFFLRVAGYGLREEFVRSEFTLPVLRGDQPGVFMFRVRGEREVQVRGEGL